MEYIVTSPALKQLKKLPKDKAKRILAKLDFYVAQEDPLSFADHLTESKIGTYRFRIGDYRVVCDIESDTLIVLAVDHRRSIYKKR